MRRKLPAKSSPEYLHRTSVAASRERSSWNITPPARKWYHFAGDTPTNKGVLFRHDKENKMVRAAIGVRAKGAAAAIATEYSNAKIKGRLLEVRAGPFARPCRPFAPWRRPLGSLRTLCGPASPEPLPTARAACCVPHRRLPRPLTAFQAVKGPTHWCVPVLLPVLIVLSLLGVVLWGPCVLCAAVPALSRSPRLMRRAACLTGACHDL